MKSSKIIAVQLEHGLMYNSLSLEIFFRLLTQSPLRALFSLFFIFGGLSCWRDRMSVWMPDIPCDRLLFDRSVLDWLAHQKKSHPDIEFWLCSRMPRVWVEKVASHLSFFQELSIHQHPQSMLNELVSCSGRVGFEFCGNRTFSFLIPSSTHWHRVRCMSSVLSPVRWKTTLKAFIKAIRVHQWAKNALILIPLIASHAFHWSFFAQALAAFFSFSFCASSVYVLNDLIDLDNDRQHHSKYKRPFASGSLSLHLGFILFPLLLGLSFLTAQFLNPEFFLVLGSYYLLTLAYSFFLKRLVFVDVMTLAALYTIRLVAGSLALGVSLSFWLLLFSLFLFLSLAFIKRHAELKIMLGHGKHQASGRGYHVKDLPMIEQMGISSGYSSILVLGLYLNSPEVLNLYRHPQWLWPWVVLFLFWIHRMWFKSHHGLMHDDPLVFAAKDKGSLLIFSFLAFTFLLSIH